MIFFKFFPLEWPILLYKPILVDLIKNNKIVLTRVRNLSSDCC